MTIRNQGKATAGPSVGEVVIQDSGDRRFPKLFNVPALKVGKRFSKTVTFTGLRPRLGNALIGVIADVRDQVDESDEGNNFAPTSGDPFSSRPVHEGEKFPIIAKEWDATTFSTTTKGPIVDIFTTARDNFRFDFSSFDGDTFTYLAYGTVDNHADQTGFCTGTSSEARSHYPWKKSSLEIDYDLSSYFATVDSPAETYTISITCPVVGSHSEQHAFGPLETYAGSTDRRPMQPATQKLFGQVSDSSVLTTWTWDLRAKLG